MDDGVAAALFALILGLPLILLTGLFAGLVSALAVIGLVGSFALAFVVANWIATKQEAPQADGTDDAHGSDDEVADALETLRERYARGDLSQAAFERKTAALVETETPEDARRIVADEQFIAGDEPSDQDHGTSIDHADAPSEDEREYDLH